jgi:CubicO group peptidase (beta-lactamase class C family)
MMQSGVVAPTVLTILGVFMSHIAGLRSSRALVPAVAIAVTVVSGVFVEPVLAQDAAVFADVDGAMENYRLDAHIPGMVWGIVQDGRLVHVKGAGVQDVDTKRPVNADTLFASRP